MLNSFKQVEDFKLLGILVEKNWSCFGFVLRCSLLEVLEIGFCQMRWDQKMMMGLVLSWRWRFHWAFSSVEDDYGVSCSLCFSRALYMPPFITSDKREANSKVLKVVYYNAIVFSRHLSQIKCTFVCLLHSLYWPQRQPQVLQSSISYSGPYLLTPNKKLLYQLLTKTWCNKLVFFYAMDL